MAKALYSNLAEICHLFYKQYFPHAKIAARLDKILKAHGCKKIVFIGGLIYVADILRRKGYQITFVDCTQEMLDEARPVLGAVPMVLGDMRHLSLPGTYDAILAIGRSFTYMYNDQDAVKTLSVFRRHLRPAGLVIIDNYETGRIDKGNYFSGAIKTKRKNIAIKRISSIRRKRKTPALYVWDCVYERITGARSSRYVDKGHLLRSFSKTEVEKLIRKSELDFISHYPNFEKRSFVTVARK
jgi:ubiquinone/menaquinone biosynthesis C-methylase UbiE